jgi:hypothetical protein|eukprot:COSAG02_NODE_18117_length_960_cov_0.976771_2_plen_80_part_00
MMTKSSFIAACVALLSVPMVFGQDGDGVLAPPRGAWNGAEGAELLQWGCADGSAQVWLLPAGALQAGLLSSAARADALC